MPALLFASCGAVSPPCLALVYAPGVLSVLLVSVEPCGPCPSRIPQATPSICNIRCLCLATALRLRPGRCSHACGLRPRVAGPAGDLRLALLNSTSLLRLCALRAVFTTAGRVLVCSFNLLRSSRSRVGSALWLPARALWLASLSDYCMVAFLLTTWISASTTSSYWSSSLASSPSSASAPMFARCVLVGMCLINVVCVSFIILLVRCVCVAVLLIAPGFLFMPIRTYL